MENLKLIVPNNDYKNQYLDFIKECKKDIKAKGFESCIPLSTKHTIEKDIIDLKNRYNGINLPKGWVPDSTLWMIDELKNSIIGVISIRHRLTESLKFRGGHISYYIRPYERNKGYATKMLDLGLRYCKESLYMDKVLITCSKNNIYSVKTILNNCGILHSEDIDNSEKIQRYYVFL